MARRRRIQKRPPPKQQKLTLSARLKQAYREYPKSFIVVVVLAVLMIGFIGVAFMYAPPRDYNECLGPTTLAQHKHFYLYIQVGERHGSLNVSFIRIPNDFGKKAYCDWAIHTHNERGNYYTKLHIESPWNYQYTVADIFKTWGEWADYPKQVYFASDGVSYYRTDDFEMLVHRGPIVDPWNNTYSSTTQIYSYGKYVMQDEDYIELIVHEPYETVGGPYEGGSYPLDAEFTVAVDGLTAYFAASADGGTAPYTFEWDFGDYSSRAYGPSASHTYTFTGTFYVRLYVKDSAGFVESKLHSIIIG